MLIYLKIQNAKELREFSFNDKTTIGRGDQNQLPIKDSLISTVHCVIQFNKERNILEIKDLKSKNGTYLNGVRIYESHFYIGDKVKIGETYISIHSDKLDLNTKNLLTYLGPKKRMSGDITLEIELPAKVREKSKQAQIIAKEQPQEKVLSIQNSKLYKGVEAASIEKSAKKRNFFKRLFSFFKK